MFSKCLCIVDTSSTIMEVVVIWRRFFTEYRRPSIEWHIRNRSRRISLLIPCIIWMFDRYNRADKIWSTCFLGFLISETDRCICTHRYSFTDSFREDSCDNWFFTRYSLFPFDDRCEDEICVCVFSESTVGIAYSRSKCRKQFPCNDISIRIFWYTIGIGIEKSLNTLYALEKWIFFLILYEIFLECKEKITRIFYNILAIEIVIDIITIPAWEYRNCQISEYRFREYSGKNTFQWGIIFYSISSCLEIFYLRSKIFDPKFIFPWWYSDIKTLRESIYCDSLIERIGSRSDDYRSDGMNAVV